jgi:hypothetical protein
VKFNRAHDHCRPDEGSPQSIDRWRCAVENYVPAIESEGRGAVPHEARVPFAHFLNQIHIGIHSCFAHERLDKLKDLPDSHPLNNQELSVLLEIVIDGKDGSVASLGVVRSSGLTAFDILALESVESGLPRDAPPREILSSDGDVYLHWEFHRKRIYACSTYFAWPYLVSEPIERAPN